MSSAPLAPNGVLEAWEIGNVDEQVISPVTGQTITQFVPEVIDYSNSGSGWFVSLVGPQFGEASLGSSPAALVNNNEPFFALCLGDRCGCGRR